jgi:broad specificity phosphatase PhoE
MVYYIVMEQEQPKNLISQEQPPKALFKLTLMRHEEPLYKDIGHDLTDAGVAGAKATGEKFKNEQHLSEEDELYLLHSPRARTKGTLEFVAEGADLKDKPMRQIKHIRSTDFHKKEEIMEHFKTLGFDPETLAKDHYEGSLFKDRPDIVEPNAHKKERLYRSMEYLIRFALKHPKDKTPHVLAVSHFEIITNIVDDVFGIEKVGKYNAPSFGESVFVEAFETENKDKVKLKVKYLQHAKEVLFDRTKRSVEIA